MRRLLFLAALTLCFCPLAPGQKRTARAKQSFETLSAQAAQAREAGQLEQAIKFYRLALAERPTWDEGWWYLGTLLYDRDAYAEATQAFQKATRLLPKAGAAWGMLGLCEYKVGRYDEALEHLSQSRRLGLPRGNPLLSRVIRYHEALVLLNKGYFETAQTTFEALSFEGMNSPDLIQALGFSVLRVQGTPGKVDPAAVQLIERVGQVQRSVALKKFDEAKTWYEQLVKDFPLTHNVNYAYGRFLLLTRRDDEAIDAYKRELGVTPDHRLARLQIGSLYIRNKNPSEGIPFVKEVIDAYPQDALAHYIMGRLYLDTGNYALAVKELETARDAYSTEPKLFYQLARAYARANRRADADKALETFTQLTKQNEEATSQRGDAALKSVDESAGAADNSRP